MDVFLDLILSKLRKSFNNPEFSDVRIVSRNTTFYAHKLILTTRAGVWSSMEKFADIEVLCWNQIEDEVAERILRWIYMGERILCEKDSKFFVKSLVKAAEFLKLSDVLEICESFFIFLDLKQESAHVRIKTPKDESNILSISESKLSIGKHVLPSEPGYKSIQVIKRPKIIKRTKMRPCGFCAKCRADDCGRCLSCRDMTKFGGPGTRKTKCITRSCDNLARAQMKRETEAILSNARNKLFKDRQNLHE